MSNYEIAQVSGISQSALSLYLSQQRSPNLETIVALAEALKVEPYQLIRDGEEKKIPADILNLLENRPESVYQLIRMTLTALDNSAQEQKAK